MVLFIWLGLAVVIGVAAGARGRSGFGWFLLAVLISPLLAGLLLIATPNKARVAADAARHAELLAAVRGEPLPAVRDPIKEGQGL
jgi:hypothetical protein